MSKIDRTKWLASCADAADAATKAFETLRDAVKAANNLGLSTVLSANVAGEPRIDLGRYVLEANLQVTIPL